MKFDASPASYLAFCLGLLPMIKVYLKSCNKETLFNNYLVAARDSRSIYIQFISLYDKALSSLYYNGQWLDSNLGMIGLGQFLMRVGGSCGVRVAGLLTRRVWWV